MIFDVLVATSYDRKLRATFWPTISKDNPRRYKNISKASAKRLNRMCEKYPISAQISHRGTSVWIKFEN